MPDPLAGQRQAINEDEVQRLLWPDDGKGCLVQQGDIFKLRTCHIEITRTMRVQSGRKWFWRAEFRRIYPTAKPLYLARTGGTTDDPDLAMSAQDDPDAATIFTAEPMDNPQNLTPSGSIKSPPEPEAIPDQEVGLLPTSVAARRRYEQQHSDDRQRRMRRSLLEEIRGSDLSVVEIEEIREAVELIKARREAA